MGLIHANARLYDPRLGRYLSPDPAVSDPTHAQSWNGYAYVGNSPLSFTDPTGMVHAGPGCNVGGVMCLDDGGGGHSDAPATFPQPYSVRVMVPFVVPGAMWGYGSLWDVGYGRDGGLGGSFGWFGGPRVAYAPIQFSGTVYQSVGFAVQTVGARPQEDSPRVSVPQPEWVSPTGGAVRGCDPRGCGNFTASRGPERLHNATDYAGEPGQVVVAPTSGVVRRLGRPYLPPHDQTLIIIDADTGHQVRVLYVEPYDNIRRGVRVRAGQPIGIQQSLQDKHPGITEHVHIDILRPDGIYVDPETLMPGRTGP